ncbi:MAG: DsbA family protein [Anaerolineales bacterium]|nr:DsbA family protein [Anaerolineales bacterium]
MIEADKNNMIETGLSEPTSEAVSAASVSAASVPVKSNAAPNPWLLLLIGLLVGGLGGFYLYPLVIPEPETNVAPLAAVEDSGEINKPDPHQAVMLAVIAGARHFQGDANAPVTLVEFGDFNCGYCGKWAHETLPLITEKYIKTGKVRMAYVHYPILGEDSMTAAQGAECAAQQQNRFWDFHNTLYANQGIGFTPANLTKLAGDMGLDTKTFEQCLANFKDQPSLDEDIRLAQVMGVRGTPAFLVNGVPLAGAYPYEDFQRVIEGTLAGKF